MFVSVYSHGLDKQKLLVRAPPLIITLYVEKLAPY